MAGLARKLVEKATAYAKERKQFGEPLARFQLIEGMLADSEGERLVEKSTRA